MGEPEIEPPTTPSNSTATTTEADASSSWGKRRRNGLPSLFSMILSLIALVILTAITTDLFTLSGTNMLSTLRGSAIKPSSTTTSTTTTTPSRYTTLGGMFHGPLPEYIRSLGTAQFSVIETVKPVEVHLDCEELPLDYVMGDVNDQVSIMTLRSIEAIEMDGIAPSAYLNDLKAMLHLLPTSYHTKPFAVRLGDATQETAFPVLAKVRTIRQDQVYLLPLNNHRHFSTDFMRLLREGDPIPYQQKIPIAFWRGTTTGWDWDPQHEPSHPRRHLVDRWVNASNMTGVDVGLSFLAQEAKFFPEHYEPMVKPMKTLDEQVHYRYLIAVEGNDVPTSLKWMLASHSTVLMPSPTKESWLRESYLIPYVHYVPLKPDTSDLLDKVIYCERHKKQCRDIGLRGTEFIRVFSSSEKLVQQGAQQLKDYLDAVRLRFDHASVDYNARPLIRCQQLSQNALGLVIDSQSNSSSSSTTSE